MDVIRRYRAREKEWRTVARNMALLVAEAEDRNGALEEVASSPLGFVEGVIGRIAQELGPEARVSFSVGEGKGLTSTIRTPGGSSTFSPAPLDYNLNADDLAAAFLVAAKAQKLIPRAKEI